MAGQEIATVLDLVEVTTGVVLVHSVVAMTMADFVDLEPEIVAVNLAILFSLSVV